MIAGKAKIEKGIIFSRALPPAPCSSPAAHDHWPIGSLFFSESNDHLPRSWLNVSGISKMGNGEMTHLYPHSSRPVIKRSMAAMMAATW